MSYLLTLLAATALSPQSVEDVRCVAVLGIVAFEQGHGPEWRDVAPVRRNGERFAGVVGERLMKETGQTREAVKSLIVADVATLQKAKDLPRREVDACLERMAVVAPPPPPPSLPRCAAAMAVAGEAVKAREGLSKGAKDLATLASVLAYRAKVEGAASGKSDAQVAASIAVERAAVTSAGGIDDEELQRCGELAVAQ